MVYRSLRVLCLIMIFGIMSAALASCISTDYVGKTYAPTTSVDVFYTADDIARPYERMGTIVAEADETTKFADIEGELVEQAMARGADAILIEDVDTIVVGERSERYGREYGAPNYYYYRDRDGVVRRGFYHDIPRQYSETAYTRVVRSKVVKALLLKYRADGEKGELPHDEGEKDDPGA